MSNADEQWYWDLERKLAVPASERGPSEHMLGPYRTKGEAEHWQTTTKHRNDAWEEADEKWNRWGDEQPASDD